MLKEACEYLCSGLKKSKVGESGGRERSWQYCNARRSPSRLLQRTCRREGAVEATGGDHAILECARRAESFCHDFKWDYSSNLPHFGLAENRKFVGGGGRGHGCEGRCRFRRRSFWGRLGYRSARARVGAHRVAPHAEARERAGIFALFQAAHRCNWARGLRAASGESYGRAAREGASARKERLAVAPMYGRAVALSGDVEGVA